MAKVKDIADIDVKVGSMSLIKGNGIEAFDFARTCDEDCPLFEHCNNDKKGKCAVHVMYMNYVQQRLGIRRLQNLDEVSKLKVATELFPLFKQLLTFKLYEASLPLSGIITEKGTMNPVYKEIRQVIVSINNLIDSIFVNKKGIKNQGEQITDPDFHTKLLKGEVKNV